MSRKKVKKPTEKKDEVSSETKPKVAEETYCFPSHGIAVKATSRKEAEKKLKEILEKKQT